MKKFAVAVKRSKWERDLIRYGSAEDAKQIYRIQNNAFEKVYESHQRQRDALRTLQQRLTGAHYLYREELPHFDYSEINCLVSLGGDNHFVYVSQFSNPGLSVIGVNSDPATSTGALLCFDVAQLLAQLPDDAATANFITEEWSRIDCELTYPDGKEIKVVAAISEVSIHSSFSDYISRYLIRVEGDEWEEQKSSGLLLSTGVGSTGWFRNCHWSQLQPSSTFAKNATFFRLIARELPAARSYRYQLATVQRNQVLEVISEMDGEIVVDAHPEIVYDFPPGCRARFLLSGEKLAVVKDISP